MSEIFGVQLKPVGNYCNISCGYCYAGANPSPQKMNYGVLESVICKCLNQETDFPTFSWHGGEPLLCGYDFFSAAIDLMDNFRKKNQVPINFVQTNAVLVTKKLAKFFKSNNFGVSVSLDGPEEIHGIYRKNYADGNTFNQVMKGLHTLLSEEIEVSVNCTITRESLLYPREILRFFSSLGFRKIKFNAMFSVGDNNFTFSSREWFIFLVLK